MSDLTTHLIRTAREFPALSDTEVLRIAEIRAERAANAPVQLSNNYCKEFSSFENGKPIFKWVNMAGC